METNSITTPMSALEEIERRTVQVNWILLQMREAIEHSDLQMIANLRAAAQGENWANRRALLAIGVTDSLQANIDMAGVASRSA